jgi:hypothetical protein
MDEGELRNRIIDVEWSKRARMVALVRMPPVEHAVVGWRALAGIASAMHEQHPAPAAPIETGLLPTR